MKRSVTGKGACGMIKKLWPHEGVAEGCAPKEAADVRGRRKKATDNKGWEAVDLSISPVLWSAPCLGPLLLLQGLNPHSKTLNQTTNSLRNINQAGQNSMPSD